MAAESRSLDVIGQDFSIESDDQVRAVFWGLGSDGTVSDPADAIRIAGDIGYHRVPIDIGRQLRNSLWALDVNDDRVLASCGLGHAHSIDTGLP